MRITDNKPKLKPVRIINKTQIQSKRIYSETQARLRKAINIAANHSLIPNNAFLEKLKIIIDAFSYYSRDEKYGFPDRRAIFDKLALTARAFEAALEAISDPTIRLQLELPENYMLQDTHKLLLKMTNAYGYAAKKESDRLMNVSKKKVKQIYQTLSRKTVEEYFILRLAGYYEDVTGNIATATVPDRMDGADPIKFASFVQMMFKALGINKSEDTISNQINDSLQKLKSYHNVN